MDYQDGYYWYGKFNVIWPMRFGTGTILGNIVWRPILTTL